jgi:hypothetical protein
MRKITDSAVEAFKAGTTFNGGNTTVRVEIFEGHRIVSMYLHGNKIAERTNKDVCVNHCGWTTPTTKERINGVLSAYNLPTVYQSKGTWFYQGGKPFGDSMDENYHSI